MNRFASRPGRGPAHRKVAGRSEWRGLLALAETCVADSEVDPLPPDACLRLASLANKANAASSTLFEREAGAASADVARAFLRLAKAFSRRETPEAVRRAMSPVVGASAAFLSDRLHALATDDFQRAHVGRPEVWG